MKPYEVTMHSANTGETFVTEVAATSASHAEKQVRGVYGKPGWRITNVREVKGRAS